MQASDGPTKSAAFIGELFVGEVFIGELIGELPGGIGRSVAFAGLAFCSLSGFLAAARSSS
jgi:hypothetical protein